MKTRLQPGPQTRLGSGQIHVGNANLGKSQRTGPGPDAGYRYGTTLLTTDFRHSPIVETSPTEPLEIRQRVWPDEVALAAAMAALAASPALRNAYIALDGDLGAGKTTLVRHLLRALGVRGRIKSPTYAVVEPHEAPGDHGPLSIWHFDFYRFADPREWEDA